jgi:hypothetical protein
MRTIVAKSITGSNVPTVTICPSLPSSYSYIRSQNNNVHLTKRVVINVTKHKPRTAQELTLVAYHEAGHAVLAYRFDLMVRLVTIRRYKDTGGRVETHNYIQFDPDLSNKRFGYLPHGSRHRRTWYHVDWMRKAPDTQKSIDNFLNNNIDMLAAGPMAGNNYCRLNGLNPNDFQPTLEGKADDEQKMKNLLVWRGLMSFENSDNLGPHYVRASALVLDNWNAIDMIAKQLLKRKRLTGWQLQSLMEKFDEGRAGVDRDVDTRPAPEAAVRA